MRDWTPIIRAARDIVNSYDYLITLRQLHYRLVMTSGLGYSNSQGDYKRLSSLTAEGRRNRTFPALLDQTRAIHVASSWAGPADILRAVAEQYRRDRTEGQPSNLILGGEKATLLAQLEAWFNDLGMPIVLLRGYGSQTYVDNVRARLARDGRPAVLIYAGDLDPSGEDILRDFLDRVRWPLDVEHIAVLEEQIEDMDLPVAAGKVTDSRAAGFIEKYGSLFQVEVEAIPPDDLRGLYQDAIDRHWDVTAYDDVMESEATDRERLLELADAEA